MQDKRLIHQCKRGSKEAFRLIYAQYRDLLLKLAISVVRDPHTAEDVVHDVFVSFAEKISDFHLTGSLKSYLSVCVVNRCRNHLLSSLNRRCLLQDREDQDSTSTAADHQIQLNEQMQAIAEAMARLPIQQRQIIALRHYARMKTSQIARSLQLSENTVKSRYRYGLDKLRQILKNNEVIK